MSQIDSKEDFKFSPYSANRTHKSRDVRSNVKLDKQSILPSVKGAEQIHDKLLRNCVRAGFGFIHRIVQTDSQYKEKKNDNTIIVNLFTSGKIGTILATDAIGIGVNVTVKRMFIPTIEKFDGTKKEKIKPAQLAQLLHRTGGRARLQDRVLRGSRHSTDRKGGVDR